MTDSFPTLARHMNANLCQVLQEGAVIAETTSSMSAFDIMVAMSMRWPNLSFTWRWKE